MPGVTVELNIQYDNIIAEFFDKVLNSAKIKNILVEAGETGVDAANSETPVRTGTLKAGNQYDVVADGNEFTLRLFNDVEYASYVNNGTSRMSPRNFFDIGVERAKQVLESQLGSI